MNSQSKISVIKLFNRFFVDERNDLDLARAQFDSVVRQLPFLHGICLIGGWILSLGHWSVAPIWATLYLPLAITLIAVPRIIMLLRADCTEMNDLDLRHWQVRTTVIAALAPVVYAVWALVLFAYGDVQQQTLVAFTIGIINLACMFCMMHLRVAMASNLVACNTIYLSFFVVHGDPYFILFAVCSLLVNLAAFMVLTSYYRDFITLVEARRDLQNTAVALREKQRETQNLSDMNLHIANHDAMTGLPNRRCFFETLEDRFVAAVENKTRIAVCIFDLGGFKPINDVYGIEIGDSLLLEVVKRTLRAIPEDTFVARLAGDEFGIILKGNHDRIELKDLMDKVASIFQVSFPLPEGNVKLGGFVGGALMSESSTTATELFEQSLFALQSAKKSVTERVVMFGEAQEAEMRQSIQITRALQADNLEDQLSVAFQPIIDIRTQTVASVECLARWHSPELGNVPPAVFIPAAERSGLINRLSLIILDKALSATKTWPENVRLSFNLSASNLSSKGFILEFLQKVENHRFDPSRLDCEITETTVMWDFNEACRAIDVLKETGIGISLDDFGTGYSSLSHVHQLPLDRIKVDRSFVTGIQPDSVGYGIVKSLLALSRDMGIACVVEGVETDQELRVLEGLGTCHVQGYLFSKPLPARELPDFFQSFDTSGAQAFPSDAA
ncbi:diguanylate cyclase (GGDEF) domain-containing protein [Roseibium denhamense]|uniref:Diguanylate cyclase (GGDEF) domain-containing protein n=2 Tax=Roseibium denhamense TaxID=76305 RepID=A0ABY1NVI0_9HYPH|nr:diguanylate cyclase (GGDEF) domain-containing protein [Roseibium denhamense]